MVKFEHAGLPCAVLFFEQAGHYCGYVGVYPGHPLYGISYDETCPILQEAHEQRLKESCDSPATLMAFMCANGPTPATGLSVHGGITYSEPSLFGQANKMKYFQSKLGSSLLCDMYRRAIQRHLDHIGEPINYPCETNEDIWWFGFDAGHLDDSPDIQDQAYMEAECRELAEQFHALQAMAN